MSFFYFFSIAIFLIACFILCLAVLIQEGKGGGLGASFGGDASDTLFGTSTPQVLKTFTGYVAAVVLALSVLLSFWTASIARHDHLDVPVEQVDIEQ